MNNPELRRTSDGSNTLFDPHSGECFHSHKGALTESEYVFLNASGLRERLAAAAAEGRALRILEMGLGTGLNFLLSAREALRADTPLVYHALEKNPLPAAALAPLDYAAIEGLSELAPAFNAQLDLWHSAPPGCYSSNIGGSELLLYLGDARAQQLPDAHFDICFFDAFSPASAPDLWCRGFLQRGFDALVPGGVWVSYCARGAVRRDLQACGFEAKSITGPPGKREMLRAIKPTCHADR